MVKATTFYWEMVGWWFTSPLIAWVMVSSQNVRDLLVIMTISTLTSLVTNSRYLLNRGDIFFIWVKTIALFLIIDQQIALTSSFRIIFVELWLALLWLMVKLIPIYVVLSIVSMSVCSSRGILLLVWERCEDNSIKLLARPRVNCQMGWLKLVPLIEARIVFCVVLGKLALDFLRWFLRVPINKAFGLVGLIFTIICKQFILECHCWFLIRYLKYALITFEAILTLWAHLTGVKLWQRVLRCHLGVHLIGSEWDIVVSPRSLLLRFY